MIHQFLDKRQILRRKKFIRIIIILGLLLLISFSGVLPFIVSFFNYVGQPIWEAKKVIVDKSNNLSYLTRTRSSLLEENKKLLVENSNLEISMINYQILEKENKDLKELFNRVPNPSNLILASILVKPSNSPYDTMIIDVGLDNGIKKDSKVYVNGNIPVGIISKVYSRTSLVELYSNPGKITAGIINNLNINVDLIGRGGSNFEMSVPFGLAIPNGTMVNLPGIKSEVVAIVDKEIIDEANPNRKIILRAPVNIQNQEWVQVEK